MPDRDQIALRFPPGTRARLLALARPGETLTSVLIRAISALEAAPPLDLASPSPDRLDALEARLAALETRLDPSSSPSRSVPTTSSSPSRSTRDYPVEVWRLAVELKDQGRPLVEIAEAMQRATGRDRPPDVNGLGSRIKQWRGRLGMP